jgi:hypothetical protein
MMPKKICTYKCLDCSRIVSTRNRPGTNVCRSCNAIRNITKIHAAGIKGNQKRPFERRYNALKKEAAKCDRLVNFSYEEYSSSFGGTKLCHYCKDVIDWSPNTGSNYFLDRKDTSEPYRLDNVVVCCANCNRMKMDHFTYEEFVKVIDFVQKMRS